jgi:hypothetical protein
MSRGRRQGYWRRLCLVLGLLVLRSGRFLFGKEEDVRVFGCVWRVGPIVVSIYSCWIWEVKLQAYFLDLRTC